MKDLSILIPENEWGRSEECGIFGISSADEKELAREVYFGLFFFAASWSRKCWNCS